MPHRATATLLVTGIFMTQTLVAEKPTPPPPTAPRPFEFPKPVRKTLSNGLTVYVIEDHRLPLISASLDVLAGAINDEPKKAGVASMTAALLREGTATRSSQEISKLVDNAGGSLTATADEDTTTVAMFFMKSFADLGFELMADITLNPKFDPEEIARQMQQAQSGLALQYSDVAYMANLAAGRAFFGKNPYAYPIEGTPQTLRQITRDDLVTFHRQRFAPSNAFLAIAGDIKPDEAMAKAEKYFGASKTPAPAASAMAPPPAPARRVLVVDMPKAVQTQISVGQTLLPRNHPDFLAMQVANQVFGGSFNSRLNLKLRANEGLTYGANSMMTPFRESGAWGVKTFTRTEKTADAIGMILDLLKEFRENPASQAEFNEAKQFMIGSFGLSVETASAVAGRVVTSAVYGLGEDYWPTYRQKLEALTLEQVVAAVRRHVQPEKVAIIASGNAKEFAKSLEPFGPVTVVPGDQMDPIADDLLKPKEKVIASAEGAEKAKSLIGAAVAAMGGRDAVTGIKDLTAQGNLKMSAPQGEISGDSTEVVAFPNRYKLTLKMPFGEVVQAVDGGAAWMGQGAMTQDAPGEVSKEMTKSIYVASGVYVLQSALAGKAQVQSLAPVEVEGRKFDAVLWKQDDFDVKVLFDPATHLIARLSYRVQEAEGNVDSEAVYSDYRDVSGVKLPFKELIYQNGQKIGERTITARQVNTAPAPETFKKK
jgi:zinc protease